ncbi:MAG: hypothetical protein EOP47_22575 [Sphingobacteriaceae bacterium]|nr:MAG: hypothetical protein EOP47_22575 [Sphingobacteriaceae bacterium]
MAILKLIGSAIIVIMSLFMAVAGGYFASLWYNQKVIVKGLAVRYYILKIISIIIGAAIGFIIALLVYVFFSVTLFSYI